MDCSALLDLARIIDHIAADKPRAAIKLAQSIRIKTDNLPQHPFIGRLTLDGVRELVVHRNYLVSYRTRPSRIEILQVWHVARRR